MDRCIPGRSGSCGKDIGDGYAATLGRQRETGPIPAAAGHVHMDALNLPASDAMLNVEIQADQREGQRDRWGGRVSILCTISIDRKLMDESLDRTG